MKLKITNLEDSHTMCPSQFNFDVLGNEDIKSGYIRYRHGFLRVELYGEDLMTREQRIYGIRCGGEHDGDIDFQYALKILKCNLGVNLVWDGITKTDQDDIEDEGEV